VGGDLRVVGEEVMLVLVVVLVLSWEGEGCLLLWREVVVGER